MSKNIFLTMFGILKTYITFVIRFGKNMITMARPRVIPSKHVPGFGDERSEHGRAL